MSDAEIRGLERRLAIARLRAGLADETRLLAELDAISARRISLERRYHKLTHFYLQDENRRENRYLYVTTFMGGVAVLRRRWRSVYREWLRVSGKRGERDRWLGPRPPCVCPPAEPGKGQVHISCGAFTIVITPGPKHSARKTDEWVENSRFTTRGDRRKRIMEAKEKAKS